MRRFVPNTRRCSLSAHFSISNVTFFWDFQLSLHASSGNKSSATDATPGPQSRRRRADEEHQAIQSGSIESGGQRQKRVTFGIPATIQPCEHHGALALGRRFQQPCIKRQTQVCALQFSFSMSALSRPKLGALACLVRASIQWAVDAQGA